MKYSAGARSIDRSKKIRLPNSSETETLINQLSVFKRGRTPKGQLRFECEGHDDHAMALFLGLSIAMEQTEPDYVRPELETADFFDESRPHYCCCRCKVPVYLDEATEEMRENQACADCLKAYHKFLNEAGDDDEED